MAAVFGFNAWPPRFLLMLRAEPRFISARAWADLSMKSKVAPGSDVESVLHMFAQGGVVADGGQSALIGTARMLMDQGPIAAP
eukprot:5774537-Pyramimonas_sp.AAC.1